MRNLDFQRNILDSHLRSVTKACRDAHSHDLARELVPLGELLQDNTDILEDELKYKDNLLPLVVEWFSTQFFSWFQPPCCEKCTTTLGHRGSSINRERKVVEHYACDNETCDFKFDFIRHNEPAILLHTKTGRCGEWAMCFFVILRALDYDARIVYDTTDHVWNEVWSNNKHRWVHVDPCESVVDTPLLYEVGWSKNLEYCIASGQYEMTDVTQRYAVDMDVTKRRRNACDESWLSSYLDITTENLLRQAPTDEIRDGVRRRRTQDIEHLRLISSSQRRIPDKSEFAGRKTGSVQWRIARGEYKPCHESKFVIRVTPSTVESEAKEGSPLFGLFYNSDGNTYKCTSKQYDGAKNWSSLTYEYQNVDFKYERDWKVSYLARFESCPCDTKGLVRWRYDLSELRNWNFLRLFFSCKTYPNTDIQLSLEEHSSRDSGDALKSRNLLPNVVVKLERADLNNDTEYIEVVATLAGGDSQDEVAWQKPQLFRQARDCSSNRACAMSVEFY